MIAETQIILFEAAKCSYWEWSWGAFIVGFLSAVGWGGFWIFRDAWLSVKAEKLAAGNKRQGTK